MPQRLSLIERLSRIPNWMVLVGFCLLFSTEVLWTIAQKSATFDEPLNLASGYVTLRFGDARLIPQNLPLVKLLAAVPLLMLNIALPDPAEPWTQLGQYRFGSDLLYRYNDADTLLLLGRVAVLPVALLLGWYVFRWASELFGRQSGLMALLLFTIEPNVLAHSGLITTDIATACFMFMTIYYWYQLTQTVTWTRAVLAALTFGLCLLSKYSSLSLAAILFVLGAIVVASPQALRLDLRGFRPAVVQGHLRKGISCIVFAGMTALVTWALIWAAYGFSFETGTDPVPTYHTPWASFMAKDSPLVNLISRALEARFLPEPYLYGLGYMVSLTGIFEGYLLGKLQPGGWWYYFLVAFAIKTPLALLALVAWASATQWRRWAQDPLRAAFLVGPPLLYFGAISYSGWNIGNRHLLPVYPFLFILAASLIPWALRQARWTKHLLVGLVAWYLLASVWISPHYLAYFNELVGGPERGHHYLVDSNLDWGQDLKALSKYLKEHRIDRVWLGYFGTADPGYYKIAYNYLPSYVSVHPDIIARQTLLADRLPPLPGTVAISATLLTGSYLRFPDPTKAQRYYEIYRERSPIAKIGYSIFVFQLE